ncbi:MAG TPA: hypothetical protein VNW99_04405 [Cytophagaceae bacterium]|jgi:hypothetical protein|nr:hypothetical protein [Cytophagaceae bacterium]
MKKIIRILSGTLFGLAIMFSSCKKKDEVVPDPQPSKFNTTKFDGTMFVIHDTIYAPAHDKGSRSFFNSDTLKVLTSNQINAKLSLSDGVIFGYFFSSDTSGSVIANTYAYFDTILTSGWHKTTTIFRKNVPLSSYINVATSNDILNAWNAATPYTGTNSGGYIYKLAVDQVFAYTTQAGKVGLIRIISVIPGNNPYSDYVLFEIKMQK